MAIPHIKTALPLYRSLWIWSGGVALISIGLCSIPLLNLLGYEYSLVIALISSIALGPISIPFYTRILKEYRHNSAITSISAIYFRILPQIAVLLVPSLLIITLNAWRVKNCDFGEGLLFYLLMPILGNLYLATISLIIVLFVRKIWRALLIYYAFLLCLIALPFLQFLLTPAIAFYNPVFGFFSGSIYDEEIKVTAVFLLYRLNTLSQIGLLLSILMIFYDRISNGLSLNQFRLASTATYFYFLFFLLGSFLFYYFRGDIGYHISKGMIQKELSHRLETENIIIHLPRDEKITSDAFDILLDAEYQFFRLHDFLAVKPKGRVEIYIYRNTAQKRRLMGAGRTQIAKPWQNDIHLDYQGKHHPSLKHELAHIFSREFGTGLLKLSSRKGIFINIGLIEGIAVAADFERDEITPHIWAAVMERLHILPRLESLFTYAGFWSHNSTKSYKCMGSFVRFLVSTRGIEKFKSVYQTTSFQAVYGENLSALVAQWRQFLQRLAVLPRLHKIAAMQLVRPSIFGKVCAHKIASFLEDCHQQGLKQNPNRAIYCFQKVLAWTPHHIGFQMQLLDAYIQGKYFSTAMSLAGRILKAPQLEDRQRSYVYERLGDIYLTIKDFPKACENYQQALNYDLPKADLRRVLLKQQVDREKAVADMIHFFLFQQGADPLKYNSLFDLMNSPTFNWMGFYLWGRLLYQHSAYPEAIVYLTLAKKALAALVTPQPFLIPFWVESEILRASAFFYQKKYEKALRIFIGMTQSADSAVDKVQLNDWIDRCRWVMGRL